jgi:8-hydroxy-5-deazaflavin:NADPH oxidoreductase
MKPGNDTTSLDRRRVMDSSTGKKQPRIGIIGGTGKEGKGLAYCWAKAGYSILIGSRLVEKAQAAVEEIYSRLEQVGDLTGMTNQEAAEQAEIIVVTVPYSAHRATIETIKDLVQGKIVIDVTVPLVPPKITKVQMPVDGSASLEAQKILGENVQVISAFQNISHENLIEGREVDCDVLVCGNQKSARRSVIELVKAAGLAGFDGGPLENSAVVEGLTSILIGLNIQYGVKSSGIRLTGVPR